MRRTVSVVAAGEMPVIVLSLVQSGEHGEREGRAAGRTEGGVERSEPAPDLGLLDVPPGLRQVAQPLLDPEDVAVGGAGRAVEVLAPAAGTLAGPGDPQVEMPAQRL